jgi:hypothetical protein
LPGAALKSGLDDAFADEFASELILGVERDSSDCDKFDEVGREAGAGDCKRADAIELDSLTGSSFRSWFDGVVALGNDGDADSAGGAGMVGALGNVAGEVVGNNALGWGTADREGDVDSAGNEPKLDGDVEVSGKLFGSALGVGNGLEAGREGGVFVVGKEVGNGKALFAAPNGELGSSVGKESGVADS